MRGAVSAVVALVAVVALGFAVADVVTDENPQGSYKSERYVRDR